MRLETDRNPNFHYLPKTNILLKPKYSAKSRIAEYRIVPTNSVNLPLFGFGRILGSNIRQNIMPKQGFGRTLHETGFTQPLLETFTPLSITHDFQWGSIARCAATALIRTSCTTKVSCKRLEVSRRRRKGPTGRGDFRRRGGQAGTNCA